MDEIVQASLEGLTRAKTGADVLAAVEVCSALHQRSPEGFTPGLVAGLLASLKPAAGAGAGAGGDKEQREREAEQRVARQRGMLRVLAEAEVVGLCSGKAAQTGELTWGVLKELVSTHTQAYYPH